MVRASHDRPRASAAAVLEPGHTFGSVTDKISADRADPAVSAGAGSSGSRSRSC